MAANLPQALGGSLAGFNRLPLQRQLGLLVAVALTVGVAVSLFMWVSRPDYQPLNVELAPAETAEAMDLLSQNGIKHRLDPVRGVLMVPRQDVHEARLRLATGGLPKAEGAGFELLEQDQGFGTSRRMESARFQRALEGELARSINVLSGVQSARVHLALPEQSVFIRDRARPGASVILTLHPGAVLDENRTAGIVHLIASSVPELEAENVTVVDQRGRLLNDAGDGTSAAPAGQLTYVERLEEAYERRVMEILGPLLGDDAVRAQVTAEVDFTRVESTRETYDPDASVLRSEELREQESSSARSGGIPGALTNQPPAGGVAVPAGAAGAAGDGVEQVDAAEEGPSDRSVSRIRNFEVDRTISHVREAPAALRRLSVAVVVDHQTVLGGETGQGERAARDEAEMNYLTGLVREAVGFDAERGDSVTVVNASFRELPQPDALPEPQLWERAWFHDLVRHALAALVVLALAIIVLRPALRTLARNVEAAPLAGPGNAAAVTGPDAAAEAVAAAAAEARPGLLPVPTPGNLDPHQQSLETARTLAAQDPGRVAQVVKQWVSQDGG